MATSVPGMSQRLAPRPNLRLRKPLIAASFHLARLALGTGRNRRHKGRLVCRAANPLAARAHPAEIGVVHLDTPRQWHFPLAPGHHRHDLVLHGPGRRLLDSETISRKWFALRLREVRAIVTREGRRSAGSRKRMDVHGIEALI